MIDSAARLDEVRRYDLFDEAGDPALDQLCELAALTCQTPYAIITILGAERQRVLAQFGLPADTVVEGIRVDESFCRYTILAAEITIVENASVDVRFVDNIWVTGAPGVRFYAGAPLITSEGQALGTLCVLDTTERSLSPPQARALALARDQVMQLLEARRELGELHRSEALRQEAVEALLATQQDLQRRIELRTRDLEDANARTRQLLERIGDGFVALDRDWRYVYVNERAAQLFQRTPRDLLGKHIWTEFPEGVGQPFHLAYERAMQEQISVTLETCYQPWDRWFENRIYPSPDGIAIFFTEITERKHARDELERSRARLVEAQRVAHVGSWEWDVAANRVVWSEELYRIYGLGAHAGPAGYEGFLAHVHPADVDETRRVISQAIAAGTPFVYDHRIVRPDGNIRMLHTRGEAISEDGKVVRLVGSCWDVSELRQASAALERTVGLLAATLEVTSDGLLVIDAFGRVAAFNEHFASLWRLPGDVVHGDARVLGLVAAQLADPMQLYDRIERFPPDGAGVERLRLKDGRTLEMRSRPQRVDGEVAGHVWSFREPPAGS